MLACARGSMRQLIVGSSMHRVARLWLAGVCGHAADGSRIDRGEEILSLGLRRLSRRRTAEASPRRRSASTTRSRTSPTAGSPRRSRTADWFAVAHDGGPVARVQPAHAGVRRRTDRRRDRARDRSHPRLLRRPAWPRGELNLPRALVTEKAFPEERGACSPRDRDSGAGVGQQRGRLREAARRAQPVRGRRPGRVQRATRATGGAAAWATWRLPSSASSSTASTAARSSASPAKSCCRPARKARARHRRHHVRAVRRRRADPAAATRSCRRRPAPSCRRLATGPRPRRSGAASSARRSTQGAVRPRLVADARVCSRARELERRQRRRSGTSCRRCR